MENNNRLKEEEFKRYMISKMNDVANALTEIGKRMMEFKTEYYEHIHKNLNHFREEEDRLRWRIQKLELAHKMFKAQVFGGITAVIGIVEIARQLFGN